MTSARSEKFCIWKRSSSEPRAQGESRSDSTVRRKTRAPSRLARSRNRFPLKYDVTASRVFGCMSASREDGSSVLLYRPEIAASPNALVPRAGTGYGTPDATAWVQERIDMRPALHLERLESRD